jgi:hypothetical protein
MLAVLAKSLHNRLNIALASLLLLIAYVGFMYVPVSATSNVSGSVSSLAVSPPTFYLSANPGDTLSESIRVENITPVIQHISVSLENFVPLGTEGQVNITNQTNRYSLISWISVNPENAAIAGYGTQIFNFKINVPQNAEPSGKFGSIIFSTSPNKLGNGSSVSVSQRVGDLILLRIAGKADENIFVKKFSVKTGGNLPSNSLSLTALVSNIGNVQVKPIGYITIRNMFGTQVAEIPFPGEYILPSAERNLTTFWKHGLLFGQYRATITALYGLSNKILTASTTFVVIPWSLIIIILVIGLVVGSLLWLGRVRIKRAVKILLGKE